ncbi:SUMF1/EgtB/PvdO family nonheme iron enzyme [Pollutimonas sp. H1-120]|uniref:formylglycine-generating enzyme family protein n=1 Tax=Pollutimonas sp. H1-120 TaxID=3148824 RepID=UPI003B51E82D
MRGTRSIARVGIVVLLAGLAAGCKMDGGADASDMAGRIPVAAGAAAVDLVSIPAGTLTYHPSGEYLKDGYPVAPPQAVVRFDSGLAMMKRQVSQAEYAACVAAGACKKLDGSQRGTASPDLPAVGVSWHDATAYAAWLSKKTGSHYRLPTYAEWVYAAGPAYKEDVILDAFDPADPAQRWLAEYALETQRKVAVDASLRPFGGFGANPAGLLDMAGNVWDWTDTCHARRHMDAAGGFTTTGENCGIRVVAGPHRSYITDFIRDPKGGACSVGVPPSNLGFRLLRDDAKAGAVTPLRERLRVM